MKLVEALDMTHVTVRKRRRKRRTRSASDYSNEPIAPMDIVACDPDSDSDDESDDERPAMLDYVNLQDQAINCYFNSLQGGQEETDVDYQRNEKEIPTNSSDDDSDSDDDRPHATLDYVAGLNHAADSYFKSICHLASSDEDGREEPECDDVAFGYWERLDMEMERAWRKLSSGWMKSLVVLRWIAIVGFWLWFEYRFFLLVTGA